MVYAMQYKVYVGNLNYSTTEQELHSFFSDCGTVTDVAVLMDKITGKARGFAFVTFEDADGMHKAISKNGSDMMGRNLKISQAEQKPKSDSRSFNRGRQQYSD